MSILTLEETIPDQSIPLPDVDAEHVELSQMLWGLVDDTLNRRARRIIDLRFRQGWTDAEIAARFGVSTQRINKVRQDAFKVLRERLSDLL